MRFVLLILGLLLPTVAHAQINGPIAGSAGVSIGGGIAGGTGGIAGTSGGGGTVTAQSLATSGPATGVSGTPSTDFTVTLSNTTFNGISTVTISDGSSGGVFTPSVGSPSTSTVTVVPPSGTTFTFTYNALTAGVFTLATTNAQGWTNPVGNTFTASAGGCTNQLDFSNSCNSMYLGLGLIS